MSPLVEGEIKFEEEAPPFSGATMYVRLEDVSVADAPARVVAEDTRRDVSFESRAGESLKFAIEGAAPDPKGSYAVRAHIDLDGDGQVSRGDFISMQSYPVLTFGYPRQVSVLVRQVG